MRSATKGIDPNYKTLSILQLSNVTSGLIDPIVKSGIFRRMSIEQLVPIKLASARVLHPP